MYLAFNLDSCPRTIIKSTNSILDKWGMKISDLGKQRLKPGRSIVYTHIVDVRLIMGVLICILSTFLRSSQNLDGSTMTAVHVSKACGS